MLAQASFVGPGGRLVRALADARARRRGAVPARRRRPDAARGRGACTRSSRPSAAGAAGVLAMVLWDDITDNGPSTLVGGALAFDTFALFVTITICAALVARRADERRLPAPRGLRRARGLRPVPGRRHRRHRDGVGQRPDRAVRRAGDDVAGVLRARRQLPPQGRQRRRAGIKYFVLGGFSSAFLLYGIALVYGAIGSTNISEMVAALSGSVPVERNDALVLAGVALLLVGLGFKVAAVPFHVWTPDVYQGAPTPVTAFMASVGKVAAFAALLRVFVVGLPFYRDDWRPAIWVLAVLSLVVGSFLAVVQTDVKRMLAYSSISHAGFILVGVEAAGHRAGEADSGLGVPSVARLPARLRGAGRRHVRRRRARRPPRRRRTPTSTRSGASARQRPVLALALTVFLVAQAGVPFTSGFIAKFGVIRGRRRRAQLRAGDHRHGRRRSSPRSCTCGSWSACGWPTRRPRARRATPVRDPVLVGPGDRRSPSRSRSSSASSPTGCSTPPSTTTQFAR